MRTLNLGRIPACSVCAIALAITGLAAQQPALPENFTAHAVMSSNLGTGAGIVQIQVTRWSTAAERERFVKTLQDQGPEALLELLRDSPRIGHIRTPDSLGYPLHYAHDRTDADGTRRVVIATDRPIGFWEQVNRPRTIDYPFTVIQMEFGGEGRGRGTISYATKIEARGDVIELERFASAPIMLNDIRSDRSGRAGR